MPTDLYKLIHLIGIFLLFAQLGGMIVGAGKEDWKKILSIMHGVGLFLLLLGGFGMLARLGIGFPWPGWLWGKLVIWLVLGGSSTLIRKMPEKAQTWLAVAVILGSVAAYLALYKPF